MSFEMKALTAEQIQARRSEIEGWELIQNHHIQRKFKFSDFKKGLDFVNQVGSIAEDMDHHPEIFLAWGKVEIKIWTHSVDGLSDKDLEFASRVNQAAAAG